MAILKVGLDGELFRIPLEPPPTYAAVNSAIQEMMQQTTSLGARHTVVFTDSEGDQSLLSEATFAGFMQAAPEASTDKGCVLKVELMEIQLPELPKQGQEPWEEDASWCIVGGTPQASPTTSDGRTARHDDESGDADDTAFVGASSGAALGNINTPGYSPPVSPRVAAPSVASFGIVAPPRAAETEHAQAEATSASSYPSFWKDCGSHAGTAYRKHPMVGSLIASTLLVSPACPLTMACLLYSPRWFPAFWQNATEIDSIASSCAGCLPEDIIVGSALPMTPTAK